MHSAAPPVRPYLRVAAIFVIATAAVAAASGWLSFPDLPHGIEPMTSNDFTAAEIARNARYRADLGRWPMVELLTPVMAALLIAVTPLRRRIVRRAQRVTWLSVSGHAGLVVSAVIVCAKVSALPAAWAGEMVDRRWSLSTQSTVSWLREQLLSIAMSGILALLLAGLAVAAIRRWPRTWALRLSWIAAAAVLVMTFFPFLRVLPPERTTALPDTPLATAMESLTDRAGLAGTRLRVLPVAADSTEINAYAAGSGPMARVVVYDTLLHDVPQSHVLSVLAHELGHVKYRDSLVLTVASSTCAGLAVLGLGLLWRRRRPGAVRLPFRLTELPPVVAAAMVMMLVMLPASNALSRTVEARADVYALELTDNPKAFARVMRTIAVQGQSYLGDEKPWGWARSHPTIAWRLALARAWARDHGIVLPPTSADVRPQGTR